MPSELRTVICRSLSTALLILVNGCSSYHPGPEMGTQEYRDSLRVLVQVCVPTGFKGDFLSISQVDRYGSRGEMRSVGTGARPRVGTSTSGQPVFETFTHQRQLDLIAILVNLDDMAYTYDIGSAKAALDAWTGWLAPLSENPRSEMVSHRLANHRDFKATPPSKDAPKARFRLVRTSDWWNKVPRRNDERPSC